MKAVSEIVDGVSTNLLFFDNRRSFEDFLNEIKIIGHNKSRFDNIDNRAKMFFNNVERFGSPQAKSYNDIINHSEFLGLEIYREQKEKIRSILKKSESLGQIQEIPNKKLKFNDLGLGVFCFPRAAVALRKHKRPDETIKIVSDVRDVYAYFPKSEDDKTAIVLYVFAGATAAYSGNEMLYNGIVVSAISEYLIENGYDVEVNVVINSYDNKASCGISIKVKSVTEDFNKNDLMLLTSDPRFYRFKGFKAQVAAFSFFDKKIDSDGGSSSLAMNYTTKLISKLKKTDAFPIIVNRCYSEHDVMKEVNRVLGIVKNS